MADYLYESELELSSLPMEYSLEMALQHNDVVSYGVQPYNTMRLQLFMNHIENHIPDKIRISEFSSDGKLTLSILLYDGNSILFTQRHVINHQIKYATYFGHRMRIRLRGKRKWMSKEYLLTTFSNLDLIIFQERIINLNNIT